ncbi:uncharacterized protein LOC129582851 [Paramacrobiotus metropolitanus]|uniref:uncharacterized protein LOC129582851 n=1 Tax=Paramacrobiotus metropolitanus TaxID=2943436 RepID=UPI0024462957|nr:uncharacterized protein LOC129582851 [Paramacrobiotus metropolitanus]
MSTNQVATAVNKALKRVIIRKKVVSAASTSANANGSKPVVADNDEIEEIAATGAAAKREKRDYFKWPIKDEDVLISWLEDNYHRLRNDNKSASKVGKANLAVEIQRYLQENGIQTERTEKKILDKIGHIEKSYRKTSDWLGKTGTGVEAESGMTRMEKLNNSTIRAVINKKCRHFDRLDKIMGDRPNFNPLHLCDSADGRAGALGNLLKNVDTVDLDTVDDTTGDALEAGGTVGKEQPALEAVERSAETLTDGAPDSASTSGSKRKLPKPATKYTQNDLQSMDRLDRYRAGLAIDSDEEENLGKQKKGNNKKKEKPPTMPEILQNIYHNKEKTDAVKLELRKQEIKDRREERKEEMEARREERKEEMEMRKEERKRILSCA